jgi:serine/threonine-protein kinase
LAWASYSRESGSGGPLVIRDVGELMPRRVEGTPQVRDPSFSPDGQWVLYYSGGPGLHKVPTAGGTRTTILPEAATFRGTSWAEDGTIVYATTDPETGLLRIGDGGGTPTVLTTPNKDQGEIDHFLPSVLPNGRGILFTVLDATGDLRVAVLDTRNQSRKVLIAGAASAHYIDAGYLVYAVSGTIFGVQFDVETLEVQGEPVTLATGVLMGTSVGAYYAVSRTGSLAYVPASATPHAPRTLVWVDRKGVETPLGAPARAYQFARLAPDGQRIAVAINDEERDLWMWDLQRSALTRITANPVVDWRPTWTPDGKSLVFSRREGAGSNVYRQSADGTGAAERLTTSGLQTFVPGSITADGGYLIGNSSVPSAWTLFALPLAKRGPAEPLQISPTANRFFPALSPNNRFVAYASNEGGGTEVFVRPFPGVNGARWQVSTAGGNYPVWARDGRELFYLDAANRLTTVAVDTTSAAFRPGTPVRLLSTSYSEPGGTGPYDVSPDGKRFLMIKEDPAARVPNTPIVLVTNVVESLRARGPIR